MNKSVEVLPFFERSGKIEEGFPSESYVAGFRQPDGSPIGVEVVLPAEMVERAVLAGSRLSVSLNPDGTFTLHADGLSDDTLDAVSAGGSLRQQSLESLLIECLHRELVAMEDDPVGDLKSLRTQLAGGLALVDRALAQLKKG
jgi:hypothetical protein